MIRPRGRLILISSILLAVIFLVLFLQFADLWGKLLQQLKNIDIGIVWGVFTLLILIISLMTFPPISDLPVEAVQSRSTLSRGRLDFWYREVYTQTHMLQPTRFSNLELKKLTQEVISFREQCSQEQVETWVEEHAASLPPEVYELFYPQASSKPASPAVFNGWQHLVNLLLGPASPYLPPPEQSVKPATPQAGFPQVNYLPNQQKLASILNFLETPLSEKDWMK